MVAVLGLAAANSNASGVWSFADGDISFDASVAYREFVAGDVLSFERTNSWTVIAQIKMFQKPPLPNGANVIFTNVTVGQPFPGYELWVDVQGHLHVRIIHAILGNFIGKAGTTDVCDSKWHVVAYTYDGSSKASGVKIYLDGKLEQMTVESDTLSGSIDSAGQNLCVGNQQGREDRYYARALIGDFSIHDVIRSVPYLTFADLPVIDSHVRLYYKFREGIGAIAHDSSADKFNANLFQ